MKKAIILDYATEQNEPSTPFKQIFLIPEDKEERDKALRKLWVATFNEDADDEDIPIADPIGSTSF